MTKWINREYVPILVNGSSERKIREVVRSLVGYGKSVGLEVEEVEFAIKFNARFEKRLELSFRHKGKEVVIEEEYLNNVLPKFISWTLSEVENGK